uniref:DUF4209 domain-containing protein n=1 Tax=Timema tahoe TaxID=61484 RepID=A0A7R9NZM7_9NEOP|nr:unnamed protein product [Timema tahoe]
MAVLKEASPVTLQQFWNLCKWTNKDQEIKEQYRVLLGGRPTAVLETMLFLTALIEHSLGKIFLLRGETVPSLLRDLLCTEELKNILGSTPSCELWVLNRPFIPTWMLNVHRMDTIVARLGMASKARQKSTLLVAAAGVQSTAPSPSSWVDQLGFDVTRRCQDHQSSYRFQVKWGHHLDWLLSYLKLTHKIVFMQVLIGTPLGMNLRNIVWHGFPSPEEIKAHFVTTLLITVASIGELLETQGVDICQLPNRTSVVNLPECAEVLAGCFPDIHDYQEQVWYKSGSGAASPGAVVESDILYSEQLRSTTAHCRNHRSLHNTGRDPGTYYSWRWRHCGKQHEVLVRRQYHRTVGGYTDTSGRTKS